jgi:hypothetical protein
VSARRRCAGWQPSLMAAPYRGAPSNAGCHAWIFTWAHAGRHGGVRAACWGRMNLRCATALRLGEGEGAPTVPADLFMAARVAGESSSLVERGPKGQQPAVACRDDEHPNKANNARTVGRGQKACRNAARHQVPGVLRPSAAVQGDCARYQMFPLWVRVRSYTQRYL